MLLGLDFCILLAALFSEVEGGPMNMPMNIRKKE